MRIIVGDVETASTKKNAIVLSLGLVQVDLEKDLSFDEIVAGHGVELIFNTGEQLDLGRHLSSDTMQWWEKQGPDAQRIFDVPAEEKMSFGDLYPLLEEKGFGSCFDMQACKWYFRGPHFDAAILETLCDDYDLTPPFKFWNVRDTRTWLDCNDVPHKLEKPTSMIPHNAMHDAAFDAWMMSQVFNGHSLTKTVRDEQEHAA